MGKFNRELLPDAESYYESRLEKYRSNGYKAKALCPFHNERTPSFSLNLETGYFKCFGCGASGDIVSFHMRDRGLNFADACKDLGAWEK